MSAVLKAPFPWFGGKSRAAALIWEGLGDVPNYVEPFAGSLAVLLGRPEVPGLRTETVNDVDCYLANFWRAVTADPEAVAEHADWPVNEADLHARHRWLVAQEGFRESVRKDPEFWDARVAGWWVWGLSCWIAGGWCATGEHQKIPSISHGGGHGVVAIALSERAIPEQKPKMSLGNNGVGNNGVHAVSQGKPHMGAPGGSGGGMRGVHRSVFAGGQGRQNLVAVFEGLAERLRNVRVCCGDWSRVLTPSVTTGHGLTGVVLDPPYALAERADGLYACEGDISGAVREGLEARATRAEKTRRRGSRGRLSAFQERVMLSLKRGEGWGVSVMVRLPCHDVEILAGDVGPDGVYQGRLQCQARAGLVGAGICRRIYDRVKLEGWGAPRAATPEAEPLPAREMGDGSPLAVT